VTEAGRLGGIRGEPRIVTYRRESLTDLLGQLTSTMGFGGLVAGDLSRLANDPPVPR
jgi:hypothetical protein